MLEKIHSLAAGKKDFGFETTLSGRSYLRFVADLKDCGYQIHIFYLWLSDITIALERVASRVKKGGHNIPGSVVGRRFKKSLTHFLKLYRPLVDSWAIFDNSSNFPKLIAYEESGNIKINDPVLYDMILEEN